MVGSRRVEFINRDDRQELVEVEPIVYRDGDSVTLQFQSGEVQSEMLMSDPNFLVLSYTRTMVAFMLLHREPRHIAMIGLGGGSMAKWCYNQLPSAKLTVIEINAKVISLRDEFYVPADDHRFHIICADGADYVSQTSDSPDVLLVDGFDIHGQPPQLCSQMFYDDCYRVLDADGLLVVNLAGSTNEQQVIDRIGTSFDDRVLVVIPESGENRVVFATKGDRLWIGDEPTGELVKKLRRRLRHTPNGSAKSRSHREQTIAKAPFPIDGPTCKLSLAHNQPMHSRPGSGFRFPPCWLLSLLR